jgi:hypothetical protein
VEAKKSEIFSLPLLKNCVKRDFFFRGKFGATHREA